MSSWECRVCGYVYDETSGVSEERLNEAGRWADPSREVVKPGTPWASLPADWRCPECCCEKNCFKEEHEQHRAAA